MTFHTVSHLQHTRWKSRWVVLMAIVMLSCAVSSVLASSPYIARPEQQSSEQTYVAAKAYLLQLERDHTLGNNRANWLTGVRTFRQIHFTEKKGALGPSSLYMSAKTYQQMFERFKQPQDIKNAQNTFLELADLYPNHSLADDALFAAAQCAQQQPGQQLLASELYQKVVSLYPTGDQAAKAQAILTTPASKSTNASPSPESSIDQAQAPRLSSLSPAKYWSSPDYCRVVLQAPKPLPFTSGTITSTTDDNRLISFDIEKSHTTGNHLHSLPVSQGLLKRIVSRPLTEDTVRVNVEVESLAEYSIFSLNDPFRIVVDVRGAQAVTPPNQNSTFLPAKASNSSQQPKLAVNTRINTGALTIELSDQKKRLPAYTTPAMAKSDKRGALSLAQQLGLGIRKITIDPGHGGKDPGAMAFGLKEKDIVLRISQKVAALLQTNSRYEVVLTRNRDVFVPLEERTAMANTNKSDLFLSIHLNAHSEKRKNGVETYFLNLATDAAAMRVAALENATSTHNIGELQDILTMLMENSKIDESTRLARFVHNNLLKGYGNQYKPHDLGIKQAPFYVLLGAQMPAVLVELAFITNPEEAKLLQSEEHLNKIAELLAAGVAAYVDHHYSAALKY